MNKDMRVSWLCQVGSSVPAFRVPVSSPEEAFKIMTVLAAYDQFQFQHNVKPDFCNMGGCEVFNPETKEWDGWFIETEDGEYFDDIDDYIYHYPESAVNLHRFREEMFKQVRFT